jgi:hypothetical protein
MRTQGPARQYRAAPGAPFDDKQAQKYGTFLERKVGLGEGLRSPADIVEASRPVKAPTHEVFEWDDAEAADQYRLQQARQLVNHIMVIRQTDDGPVVTRAYHSVVAKADPDDERATRGYVSEAIVWREPKLRDQVVRDALRELQSWRDRYQHYAALAAEVALVEQALKGKKAA